MAPNVEYGFFALARAKGGVFRKPDGSTEAFDDLREARKAMWRWTETEVLPKAVAAARESREAFCNDCTIEVRRVQQPGLFTADRVVSDIHGPDGEVIAKDVPDDHQETRIKAAAQSRFPEPTAEKLPAAEKGEVSERVIWTASLFIDGKQKDLPSFGWWVYGFPIESVLGVLNELAVEGWSVVQVSEDRGLYSGTTTDTDSAVTKARYLLVRGR